MESLLSRVRIFLLEFAKKQREVSEWKIIMECIEAKRSVGRHFCLLDGRLFKQKSVYGRTYLRFCVPPEYRSLILKSCHDDPVAGHLGIQRILTKIIGRFFWNTLTEDVTMNVKSCLLCQKRKNVCSLLTGMLQTIKVERPFQKIAVDLLGPFPTSVNGNKMLIVAVDYLTKWVELEALPTGKADVVTQFIVDKIVLHHGAPESIITDRGNFFLAGITQNVWEKLVINHKTTSGYHPKTNGQVERMNHTLEIIISMYITDEQTNRDEKN